MNNRITTSNIINHKKIPAQKTKLNGFECWQINLHRSKAANYKSNKVNHGDGNFFKVMKKINVLELVFMLLLI